MFVVNGRRGKYRAVSITGDKCDLGCEHCKGSLLKTMPAAATPEMLLHLGRQASERGDRGILVTGGCDSDGRLPWKKFVAAISTLKAETDLAISVHTGQIDRETAHVLKESGVDQALVDIIGDDATRGKSIIFQRVRRHTAHNGISGIGRLEIIPHVVLHPLWPGKR
jgi:uncharacterized radical SAM superfamily protein